jgi:hypothetical protein
MKIIVFALSIAGCASVAPVAPSAVAAPIAPASREYGSTVAKAVGAYLRTFKLDEKTLGAGLAIPWAGVDPKRDYINGSGVAVATGKLGPQGHQVYEVIGEGFTNGGCTNVHEFIEIGPEPDGTLSSVTSDSATH